jgi:ACT domain-containing protein
MIDNTIEIITPKIGRLNLAEKLGNVSQACKVICLSRDTFYRYQAAIASGGLKLYLTKQQT